MIILTDFLVGGWRLSITIERVNTIEQCALCGQVANQVWGAGAVCSPAQMVVHAQSGGVVLLALEDDCPVALLFSFPARYRGEWVLWSHETAVLPNRMHLGIGYQLKQVQRTHAEELGYKTIVWTYDPLISRNAHFNLQKLGAQITEFKRNAYGTDENDLVNQGLETDRFVATWATNDKVRRTEFSPTEMQPTVVLACDEDQRPVFTSQHGMGSVIAVDFPLDFAALVLHRRPVGEQWRTTFRETAVELFARGYQPELFERTPTFARYIWMMPEGDKHEN